MRRAVFPWALAFAFPLAVLLVLLRGTGPAAITLALGWMTLVAVSWAAGGALALLLVLFPLAPRVLLGPVHVHLASAFVLLALFAWSLSVIHRGGSFRALPGRVGRPLTALVALMLLSAIAHAADLGSRPADLMRLIQFGAYLLLLPLAFDLAPRRGKLRVLVVVAVAAAVIEAVYALALAPPGPQGFVVGTFDHEHNNFAAEMVMALLLAAGVITSTPGWRVRVMVVPVGAVLAAALLLSQSRTGLVAVLAGSLTLFTLPLSRPWRVVILAGLLVAAGAAMVLAPAELRARVAGAFSGGAGEMHGWAMSRRFTMWTEAAGAVRAHPLLGAGIWSRSLADNFYVKVAVELGVAGLVAFGWFLFATLRESRRIALAVPSARGLFPAAVALLLVMNLAGDFLLVHRVMGTFWILAGAGLRVSESPASG